MRKIQTAYFGELSIDEEKVICFDNGIPGFETHKEFILLNNYDTEEPVPFMWLQSLADGDVAFVVSIPFFLRPDYDFDIPDEVCKSLDIDTMEQVGVYSICRIGGSMDSMTFNLRSPIIINAKNNKALQYVMPDPKYTSREMIKK